MYSRRRHAVATMKRPCFDRCSKEMPGFSSSVSTTLCLMATLLLVYISCQGTPKSSSSSSQALRHIEPATDTLVAYNFKPNAKIPAHAESADPHEILQHLNGMPFINQQNGTALNIDEVHRKGLPHFGVWLFLCDNQQRMMVMYRSAKMVTCPNTWSLMGEHMSALKFVKSGDHNDNEDLFPERTVLRGMEEELGFFITNGSFIEVQHNLIADKLPIYFLNDYGPSLHHRTDRQLTYFWFVKLKVSGEALVDEIKKHGENTDEVGRIKWMTLDQVEQMILNEPDSFCNEALRIFFKTGLPHLQRVLSGNKDIKESV